MEARCVFARLTGSLVFFVAMAGSALWWAPISATVPDGPTCSPGGIHKVLDRLPESALREAYECYRLTGVEPSRAEQILAVAFAAACDRETGEIWVLEYPGGGRREAGALGPLVSGLPLESRGPKTLPEFLSALEGRFPALGAGPYRGFMLKLPSARSAGTRLQLPPAAAAPASSGPVLSEDFESDPWSRWTRSDWNDGAYTWARSNCANHTPGGGYCLDGIRGGTSGSSLACDAYYPDSVDTYVATTSCLAIQGAPQAWLEFYHTHLTDTPTYSYPDLLGCWVDVDNLGDAWGWMYWGDWSAGWYRAVFNMKQWYKFGDLTSYSCARLIFEFYSNSSYSAGFGARIDDVTVRTDAPTSLNCSITADITEGPAPLTVHLQSHYEGAGAGVTTEWYSGDQGTGSSSEPNPAFTYSTPGTYFVELSVQDKASFYQCAAVQRITVQEGTACPVPYGADDCSTPPGTSNCCCFVPEHTHDLGAVFPAQSLLRVRYRAGTPLGVCQESTATISASASGDDYTLLSEEVVPARSGVGDVDHWVDYRPAFPYRFVKVSIPVCYNDDSAAKAWCGTEPPSIVTQPADQTISAGQGATLSVLATGTETLRYQWYIGLSGDTQSPVPGAVFASMTTPPLYETTPFWVWITNDTGSADSRTATVTVTQSSGILRGDVGILSGGEFFPLNAQAVTGTVELLDGGGSVIDTCDLSSGTFDFGTVQSGDYRIRAGVNYIDRILYDASLLEYGCTAPADQYIRKTAVSAPVPVTVQGTLTTARISFPPPVVFLHGALECYEMWTTPASPDAWETAASRAGFLTFTPHYTWWGTSFSWPGTADQVAQQVLQDLQGLRAPQAPVPPWTLVTHDMGGLVARVLTSGNHRSDALLGRLGDIFLLGAPNSGSDLLLGGGNNSLLSVNSIVRRFNEVYPDFGDKTTRVYSIGGTADWWGAGTSDGPLSVSSAFNVGRLACGAARGQGCTPYSYLSFDSGAGHLFDYGHYELVSADSTEEILRGVILQLVQGGRTGVPESPAGGLIWGTGARTSGTAQGSVQNRRTPGEYAFPIGETDGMAIAAWVTRGSAEFQVLDPDGRAAGSSAGPRSDESYPGYLFTALNPVSGTWTLRVLPGPEGATFSATAAENSLFGISGFVEQSTVYPSQTAPVRVELDGTYDSVTLDGVSATLFDPFGVFLQEVQLHLEGEDYTGTLTAPDSVGSCAVTFEATGTYGNKPFARYAFERLNVIPSPQSRSRFFLGGFTDQASDTDGDGKFDTIVVEVDVAPPGNGTFAISGDLYDGSSRWVGRASNSLFAEGTTPTSAAVAFSLEGVLCHQLSSPLEVRNLTATDASTLVPIDLWTPPISTRTYDPGTFACNPSAAAPAPVLRTVRPDQGIRGQSLDLLLAASNIDETSTVSLGDGITVNGTLLIAEGLLKVSVSILPGATPGLRALKVTHPGVPLAELPDAFEVKASSTPWAAVAYPHPDEWVKGAVTVNASASSDLRVTRVDFLVDGLVRQSDAEFPFAFAWDTTDASEGRHSLSAVAQDESGQTSLPSPISVVVDNHPVPGDCDGNDAVSIGEVQKAINMFLGITPPGCAVDCNGDGVVSIGEVQKVINGFLGLPTSC